jgi:hypothetical protein
MGIVSKVFGPLSKYDKSLPYTYMAKITIIEGDDELDNCYFADTICGLVEHFVKNQINPEEVKLFGCFRKKEISLDNDPLLDADGNWLQRPKLCKSLEEYYQKTMDDRYKGHEAHSDCSFDDRNREAY